MSKKTLCILYMPLLLFLFLFPKDSFQASCTGVSLWFETVLPSLLPFLILSGILLQTEFMKAYKLYAWITGILCGYPMGAKNSADLLRTNKISKKEAQYLLTCSNQASPMFLNTYIGFYVFYKDQKMLFPFLVLFYLSVLLCALLLRFGLDSSRKTVTSSQVLCTRIQKEVSEEHSKGTLLDTSIMNAFETITRLGGYIILFTIYGAMLRKITVRLPILSLLGSCLLELTSGLACVRESALSPESKLLITLCCTAFGGLSTILQTNCVISGSGLSIKRYIAAKILQTMIALLLGLVFIIL
ncbi:MAG: hypothetical protein PHG16_01115 [Lachnospiraceae bacterium]|nr:hypothetical protein [Lachnospiraceae bacterium]